MRGRSSGLIAAGLLAVLVGGFWIGTKGLPWHARAGAAEQAVDAAKTSRPWTIAELRELTVAVRSAEQEGLRPSDYRLNDLEASVAAGRSGPDIDAVASAAAATLAHDFAAGRVVNRHRFNWYIDYAGADRTALAARSVAAREHGQLGSWLASLLPTSAAYQALRTALGNSAADDGQQRDRIIANMERWRWLPRDFGSSDQLYVNLPTYKLQVSNMGRSPRLTVP